MENTNNLEPKLQHLKAQNETLRNAAITLKKEFIGIDNIIDKIVDGISAWYLFPELQERPTVINLWGMTGVGKTSLITRLSELINFEKKFYRFDLGASGDDMKIKRQMQEIYENLNQFPIIIGLDEFQHGRTINENGHESEKNGNRIIWDLLDSGKFHISRSSRSVSDLYEVTIKCRFLLSKGVRVENGYVVSDRTHYASVTGSLEYGNSFRYKKFENESDGPIPFIPEGIYGCLSGPEEGFFPTEYHVAAHCREMNGDQSIDFLYKMLELMNSPRTVDCTKALIFVLGNLDEAYGMAANLNPDLSADEFHEESLKITIPKIKKALRHRFRNEQIGRLGNFHIIYPAFNKDAFERIIRLELEKVSKKYRDQHNLDVVFDQSIIKLIYDEGVYPTQGTRPVFSTISQLIRSRFGKIYSSIFNNNVTRLDQLKFTYIAPNLIVDVFQDGKHVYTYSDVPELSLEKLRESKMGSRLAITSVHEAGHAIISSLLLNTIPEVVQSSSIDDDFSGFNYTKINWALYSKKDITTRASMLLGGLAAEKIVFGDEQVTPGSESDIARATSLITSSLRESGMGKVPGKYGVLTALNNSLLVDKTDKLTLDAEKVLQEAEATAVKVLGEQKLLLLKMSGYLLENRKMDKETIAELISKYAVNPEAYRQYHPYDYLSALQNAINSSSIEKKVEGSMHEFSLNKGTIE